jgi:ACS family hexuronate transporter-like MFS transporter
MDKNPIGKYRWVIAALLLFATTINYMDRQVISYLKEFFSSPVSTGGFGWSNTDFAVVTSVFTAFYAIMTVFAGWFIDKIGTKLGLGLSLIVWSVFGMLNAFAGSTVALHAVIRSLFGIGEGGNFPASIKTVAEWFPKKERALATGIFNSGSSLGAMAAALFVPSCLLYFGPDPGWKYAFLITGAIGFVWLFFWFALYSTPAENKKLGKSEFDYIHSDDLVVHAAASEDVAISDKISWGKFFTYPQTWAFIIGKFMTDGVWWFLLFWLPDYLKKQFGFTGHQVMWPTFIVYGIAIFGSTFGGSIPLFLINNGMTVRKARMAAMFIIALFPLLLLLTQYFGDKAVFGTHAVVLAVGVICIGGAAHQAWSANLFTTVSDMFPKRTVGSVTGIGGLAGGLGGVIVQQLAGHLTDHYKATPQIAYSIMFTVCALAYMSAWLIIRFLTRKAPKILV